MKLRDYQEDLSLQTRQSLLDYRKVLLCSPTGSGKTVIAADIFLRASKKGIKPVFLTDRIEIAKKTAETFREWGLNVQLITADTTVIYKADCYIAMVETFYRRVLSGRFPKDKIKLLFCDEAHMAVFNKVIELFPNAYICGLTATPVSSSFNMKKVYDKIIMGNDTPTLIENNYLVPSIDIGQEHILDLKYERGEFSAVSQRSQFKKYSIDEKFIELWKLHAKDRSTIVYNIDIEHNNKMGLMFNNIGVTNCVIDSKMDDKDRERLITDYNKGNIQVMLNVGVATKGFDSPITSCIGYNRSTASMSNWFQAIGRGGRLYKDKSNFITIDTGNNIIRHGSFNETVDWKYLFDNPDEDIKKQNKIPKKLCNVCFAYVRNVYLPNCVVCGSNIVIKNLISLESQMPIDISNKLPRDMTFQELLVYQKFKGFKNGWAFFQHGINNKRKWNQQQGQLL